MTATPPNASPEDSMSISGLTGNVKNLGCIQRDIESRFAKGVKRYHLKLDVTLVPDDEVLDESGIGIFNQCRAAKLSYESLFQLAVALLMFATLFYQVYAFYARRAHQ